MVSNEESVLLLIYHVLIISQSNKSNDHSRVALVSCREGVNFRLFTRLGISPAQALLVKDQSLTNSKPSNLYVISMLTCLRDTRP